MPQRRAGQVLIQVRAFAGVNRPDVIQRQGFYPPPPGASPIPGLETGGRDRRAGRGRRSGACSASSVCALVRGGGYAEYCLAHAGHCLPVPDGLSLAEAAALPETLFTVWHNVFERGWAQVGRDAAGPRRHQRDRLDGDPARQAVRPDRDRHLRQRGEMRRRARDRGRLMRSITRRADFVAEVKAFTGGKGVEVVLDMVAGDYVARNLQCLAEDGRHVTIAVLGGVKAEINMAGLMIRRATLTGSTLRPRSDMLQGAAGARDSPRTPGRWWTEGRLRPVMDQTFPLAEAAAAHARMEAGDHIGKIVLDEVGDMRYC